MGILLRFVVNMLIATLLLAGFDRLEWITVHSGVSQSDYWLTLVLIALASVVVSWFFFWAWMALSALTCGLGCLLAPVVAVCGGWVSLWGVAEYTPFLSINIDFWWLGLLMSLIYGLLRIPAPVQTSTTTYRFTSRN